MFSLGMGSAAQWLDGRAQAQHATPRLLGARPTDAARACAQGIPAVSRAAAVSGITDKAFVNELVALAVKNMPDLDAAGVHIA